MCFSINTLIQIQNYWIKWTFLLFFILIINNLNAQNIKTITEKSKGILWSNIENIDSFDTENRLVKRVECWDKRCKKQSIYKYIYDENGRLTENVLINRENGKDSLIYHHKQICYTEWTLAWNKETTEECLNRLDYPFVYHSNKNNQLIRMTKVDSFDLNNLDFPFYNPFGTLENLKLEQAYFKGTTDHFCRIDNEFDNDLLIFQRYNYYKNDSLTAISTYKYDYDSSKRRIRKTITDEGFQVSDGVMILEYIWEKDRLVERTFIKPKSNRKEIESYHYNDKNYLTKIIKKRILPKEKILTKTLYKYEYYNQ